MHYLPAAVITAKQFDGLFGFNVFGRFDLRNYNNK